MLRTTVDRNSNNLSTNSVRYPAANICLIDLLSYRPSERLPIHCLCSEILVVQRTDFGEWCGLERGGPSKPPRQNLCDGPLASIRRVDEPKCPTPDDEANMGAG